MEQSFSNEFFKFLNHEQKNLLPFISKITEEDKELFKSNLDSLVTKSKKDHPPDFENSFEYIRLYFNSGRFRGLKFYDDQNLIMFALEKKKKPHFKLYKPLGGHGLQKFTEIITLLSSITNYPIQIVCLDNEHVKILKKQRSIKVKNIKEFKYYIYDLNKLTGLSGNQWKTVRQKITAFNRNYPKLKIEHLTPQNYNKTIHFIGAWRRELLANRGLSYANLEKNKFAAQYYSDKNDFENIWATVYSLDTRVVAFQLLYRLGPDAAAHAIGLADTKIKGLSEFAQIHIWEQLHDSGIRYINDGPSWRPELEKYKLKFNPITSQQGFECKVQGIKN